eukprot:scaffold3256_cov444-Prasinococcus_capsulatus_cf.AAC.9
MPELVKLRCQAAWAGCAGCAARRTSNRTRVAVARGSQAQAQGLVSKVPSVEALPVGVVQRGLARPRNSTATPLGAGPVPCWATPDPGLAVAKCPQPGGLVNVKASSSWHAIDSPPHATPGRTQVDRSIYIYICMRLALPVVLESERSCAA